MLRKIFGPERDGVTGEWRKPHNEELNNLYSSPNIFRVMKSRRMRWARQVARMSRDEVRTRFRWGNLRERDQMGDSDVGGRVIIKWIFSKWDVDEWSESIWRRIGTVGGHLSLR